VLNKKALMIAAVALFVMAGCKSEIEPNNTPQQAQASHNIIGSDQSSYYGNLIGGDTDVWAMDTSGTGDMTVGFLTLPNQPYDVSIQVNGQSEVSLHLTCAGPSSCETGSTFNASHGSYSLVFSGSANYYGFGIEAKDPGIVIIGRTSDPGSH
jgi:hypothetical protein